MTTAATSKPRRLVGANRDFTLLWTGQVMSSVGSAAALIAYPLLALVLTHSPKAVGLVVAAGMIAQLAAGLPGGVLIDRVEKRYVMLTCDAVRAMAQTGLAVGGRHPSIALLVVVVVIDNALSSVFFAAEPTAVRHVVREEQIPLALARIEARDAAAMLAAPPLGGLLFALSPGLPFALNAVSYVASFICIAFIRSPMPSTSVAVPGSSYRLILDGLRWIWRHRFLRVTLLLVSGNNLVSNAVMLVAIVVARQHGASASATGLLLTFAGCGGLIGALLAPRLVQRLSLRIILIANRLLWTALVPLFFFLHVVYAIGAVIGVMYLMGPTGTTAVRTHQMRLTPDELQGRVSGARSFCTGVAAPIGTATTGYALGRFGLISAVALITIWLIAMATIAVTSPSLKLESKAHHVDTAPDRPLPVTPADDSVAPQG